MQFDGTKAGADVIFAWLRQAGIERVGHYRPGSGDVPGSMFIPVSGGDVWRLDKGDWIVRSLNQFWLTKLEKFAELYEVVECLPQ